MQVLSVMQEKITTLTVSGRQKQALSKWKKATMLLREQDSAKKSLLTKFVSRWHHTALSDAFHRLRRSTVSSQHTSNSALQITSNKLKLPFLIT